MLKPESCCYNQVNSYFLKLLNHSKHTFCQNFFADSRWWEEGMCLFISHLLPLHMHNALTHEQHSIISLLILHWELYWADPQAPRCLWDGQYCLVLGWIFFIPLVLHHLSQIQLTSMLRKHKVPCLLLVFVIHSLTHPVLLDKHNCRNAVVLYQCNYFLLVQFASWSVKYII